MKRKPNYKLKAAILTEGDMCKTVKDYDFLTIDTPFLEYIDKEHKYIELMANVGTKVIHEVRNINIATYKRVERLKSRIKTYLEMGECIWLTLTFSEEVLNNTNLDTRRKYVQRYLKSQSDYYVANIDFGSKTEREHYHAVVVSSFINKDEWIYGFTWTERIKNHQSSDKKLAKYVSKLTNHAIKETTKRQCYIYSRCKL